MRKTLLLAAVVLLAVALESCAKKTSCAANASYNKYRNYGRR